MHIATTWTGLHTAHTHTHTTPHPTTPHHTTPHHTTPHNSVVKLSEKFSWKVSAERGGGDSEMGRQGIMGNEDKR